MQELIEYTADKNIRENPDKIAETITTLAEDIDSMKGDLSKIKDRKWYQRMSKDTTGDLADAMIKQNDTIATFFNVIQHLLELNMNNVVFLGGIMEKLNEHELSRGISGNRYIDMAKNYLKESINAAQQTNNKFIELESHIEKQRKFIISFKDEQNKKNNFFLLISVINLILGISALTVACIL